MEIFLLVVVVVLLVVMLMKNADHTRSFSHLQEQFFLLRRELEQIHDKLQAPPAAPAAEPPAPVIPVVQEVRPEPEIAVPEPEPEILPETEPGPIPELVMPHYEPQPIQVNMEPELHEAAAFAPPAAPAEPEGSWWDRWLANNPDLEKFIGENLINKIGIAILVLGISFFVKYAIDQDWINETGRVAIGVVSGGILLGIGHRLRGAYRSFSSVLVGGAMAVFYFSIAYGFHQYQLFSQTAAFIIMVVITIFAIVLALLYDRLELAVIATIGGFITPFLVSTGEGNYIVLFTYLCILNAGLIVLALYKQWRPVYFIAFCFTILIYGGWIIGKSDLPNFSFGGTLLFGTVFYLLFVTMNLVHHVGRSGALKVFDFSIILSINVLYYAAGYYLLTTGGMDQYTGLFTAAMGVFNLVLCYSLYRNQKVDRNFIFLLIGITLSFISLAAPVQLDGNNITLFWAAEMVVLFWLYQKSFIRLFKFTSLLLTVLVTGSLLLDWAQVYGTMQPLTIIANRGCMTSLVVVAAMLVMYRLLYKEADMYYLYNMPNKDMRAVYLVGAIALLFFAGMLELNLQFVNHFRGYDLSIVYQELYIFVFFAVLILVLRRAGIRLSPLVMPVMAGVLFLVYLCFTIRIYALEVKLLQEGLYRAHFAAHWLALVVLGYILVQAIKEVRFNERLQGMVNGFTWAVTIGIIILLSVELHHLYVWFMYLGGSTVDRAETVFAKAGLSITWGVTSFIIIWLGLSRHVRTLRIIALSLFGLTILKLFAYDLRNISSGGKIAAFILLGALLLTVSFMYQRLKNILIEDRPAGKTDETEHEEHEV